MRLKTTGDGTGSSIYSQEIRPLRVYFFANREDNVAQTYQDLTWAEFVALFSEHQIVEDKNTMMFCTCTYRDQDDNEARPATRPIYRGDVRVGDEIKVDELTGKPHVGRVAHNVLSYSALMLDYDDGLSMEKAVEQFQHYTHLGYTSYNHLKEGKEKFRIVLPLASDIPVAELRRRKKSILEWAQGVDHSCLAVGRGFFIPSCSAENLANAFTWNIDGLILPWEVFDPVEDQALEGGEYKPIPVDAQVGGIGKILGHTFDIVRFMQDQGLYIKSCGYRKHEVVCPNHAQHSGGAKAGTVIYEGDAMNWPTFYCSHGHCKDFNGRGYWQYFKQALGHDWMRPYCLTEKPRKTGLELALERYGLAGK